MLRLFAELEVAGEDDGGLIVFVNRERLDFDLEALGDANEPCSLLNGARQCNELGLPRLTMVIFSDFLARK